MARPPSPTARGLSGGGAAAGALVLLLMAGCASAPPASPYLDGFTRAERDSSTFSPASEVTPGISLAEAYVLQRRLVAARIARGDRVSGYRGGLMSAASLNARKVSEPLTGVMFGSMESAGQVTLCGYRRANFELKLGFVFKTRVQRPVKDVAELRGLVGAVQPVIDLPDIAYRDPNAYGAADMVAANISSARYVRGQPHPANDLDLDKLTVSLERDGVPLARGLGRESLDGQWGSLLTLVNLRVRDGGRIEPGQFMLTGKIGDKGTVPPGRYRADYGPLGVVSFETIACRR